MIITSGIVAGANHLVTNDSEWQRKLDPLAQRVHVCYLGQYIPPGAGERTQSFN